MKTPPPIIPHTTREIGTATVISIREISWTHSKRESTSPRRCLRRKWAIEEVAEAVAHRKNKSASSDPDWAEADEFAVDDDEVSVVS